MNRRTVLKWMGAVPVACTLPLSGDALPNTPLWRTIAAVQNHLIPGGGGAPSAAQVDATGYLHMTMAHHSFDYEIRDFIIQGASWPEEVAEELFKSPFTALSVNDKERVIRHVYENYDRGEGWLSTLISYTLEAVLGDPIYGVNMKEQGWKWLAHVPGEPRPKKRFVHGV